MGLFSPAQAQRPDPTCIRGYEGQIKRVKALGPKAEATQDPALGQARRQLLQQLEEGHGRAKRGKDNTACFLLPALKGQVHALEARIQGAGRPPGSPTLWPVPYQAPPRYVPFVAPERVGDFIAACPGFIDITGACYQCPAGTKKNLSLGGLGGLRTGDDPKACAKTARRRGSGPVPVGTPNAWPSVDPVGLYVCPSGYEHTDLDKKWSQDGVCTKVKGTTRAEVVTLGCAQGVPLPDGGCYRCPAHFKVNPLPVSPETACMSEACGGDGQRICQASDRKVGCASGLIPDPSDSLRCLDAERAAKKAACLATATAFRGIASLPAELAPQRAASKAHSDAGKALLSGEKLAAATQALSQNPEAYASLLATLRALQAGVGRKQLEEVFKPENLCNPETLNGLLAARGLQPAFDQLVLHLLGPGQHSYVAFSLFFAVNAGIGVTGGYTVVTDFQSTPRVYLFVGPLFDLNVALGDSFRVQFFPRVELANFEGWGLDVAGNGGTPIGKVGVGADLYLDCPFCVDQPSGNVPPTFLGIGAGPNLGLGVAPADMGISAAFSKRLL